MVNTGILLEVHIPSDSIDTKAALRNVWKRLPEFSTKSNPLMAAEIDEARVRSIHEPCRCVRMNREVRSY